MGLSSERATTRERDHQDDKEHDLDDTERAITIDRGKRACYRTDRTAIARCTVVSNRSTGHGFLRIGCMAAD